MNTNPSPAIGDLKRRLPVSLVLNIAVPAVLYAVLRTPVHSDVTALAIAAGVPVLVTIAMFIARRRLDPIGVVSVVGFAIALILVLLTGGNELVLKLHEALITGPIGVLCLASVLVGRPLYGEIWKLVARRNPQLAAGPLRRNRRVSVVLTTLIGAMLTVHAAVLLVFALVMPTGTYLAVARPIGLGVIGAFVLVLFWYRNRLRIRPPVPDTGNR